jgi:hypothetical protein
VWNCVDCDRPTHRVEGFVLGLRQFKQKMEKQMQSSKEKCVFVPGHMVACRVPETSCSEICFTKR